MKILLAMILFSFMAGSTMARIVQHDDQSIDDDLNFKLDSKKKSERELASDDQDSKDEVDGESEDSERDVASDGDENSDSTIKYWKY